MKQRDHRALAHDLLRYAGERGVWRYARNRHAFVLGCVSPDYLPATYLRGFGRSHAMRGHNAIYSAGHIKQLIARLQEREICTLRDCYALGLLMHYLADSFTHAHNEAFVGDMRAHRLYENCLHQHFTRYLRRLALCDVPEHLGALTADAHWYRVRRRYEEDEEGFERDCRAIVDVCRSVLRALLRVSKR